MNLSLITEEQSKKLAKLGFDRFEYQTPIDITDPIHKHSFEWYPGVTVALALQWLREEKGCFVLVDIWDIKPKKIWMYDCRDLNIDYTSMIQREFNFNSYDEAQSAGLDAILNYLLEKQILVTERDKEIFFNALENPKGPNEALKKAAENYKQRTKND